MKRLLASLVLALCLTSSALAQTSEADRIVCGNANLSLLSKSANSVSGETLDPALRKILMNSDVNALIIQSRTDKGDNGEPKTEHRLLYAARRNTELKTRKLTEADYKWLLKIAEELHSE